MTINNLGLFLFGMIIGCGISYEILTREGIRRDLEIAFSQGKLTALAEACPSFAERVFGEQKKEKGK